MNTLYIYAALIIYVHAHNLVIVEIKRDENLKMKMSRIVKSSLLY